MSSSSQRIDAVQIEEALQEEKRSFGQPAPCLLFVGDTAISEADIAREMQFHPASTPAQSRREAARALMVRELLRLECERLNLAVDIALQENESQEEACIRVLLEREIKTQSPSDDDCLRYFEQNRERFCAPISIRAKHILLAAAPDDVEARSQAHALAEQLLIELRNNRVLFADFALRYSACPSKEQGGDLGSLQRGQTVQEFDRQLFRLPQGLAPFPLESRWGYHLVHIDDIQQGAPLTFVEVKTHIANYLELQVQHMEVQHYLSELQARFGVRGWEHFDV